MDKHDKWEAKFSLYFLLFIGSMLLFWNYFDNYSASIRVGAMGGFIAFVGVFLMSLPVIRVGPFQWVDNVVFEEFTELQSKGDDTSEDSKSSARDRKQFDHLNQTLFGPYLIGLGTLVNGFSGFF